MSYIVSQKNNFSINFENIATSPRQADLLIIAGPVTQKAAPKLLTIYEQMPSPKYVLAMGTCACSGGMFNHESLSIVNGVDKILPVDIYLPTCPPSLDAINLAFEKLRAKIFSQSRQDRQKFFENNFKTNGKSDILTVQKF
jgi:NAD(P)H-quinone oxidoreductase subunit K